MDERTYVIAADKSCFGDILSRKLCIYRILSLQMRVNAENQETKYTITTKSRSEACHYTTVFMQPQDH